MDKYYATTLKLLPIDTKDQLADICTKPLPQETIESLRDKVQGIDSTRKHHTHCQTRECEFYEQKKGS